MSAPAIADDASRLQVARNIVDTTHAADNLRKLMPIFMQQMRGLITQQHPTETKQIDAFFQQFTQKFDGQTGQFVDLVAQIYAREFSEDDLNGLLAFYKTPVGQRLLDKQVTIAQSMAQVGQQWGEMMAKQVLADFAKDKKTAAPKL